MWRFIEGASPPPAKKNKTKDEKLEQQRVYENTDRQRQFQTQWQSIFPWLRYDESKKKMSCSYCPEYDSSSFKRDTLTKHEASKG